MNKSRRAITSLAVAALLLAGFLYQRSLGEPQEPADSESSRPDSSPDSSERDSEEPVESPVLPYEAPPGSSGSGTSEAEPSKEDQEPPTDPLDAVDTAADELSPDLRAMIEHGGPYTDEAMERPVMKELEPADPDYDPIAEAHQTFHAFEQTLLAADPLDSVSWKAALAEHQERNAGVMRRADFLRRSGHSDDARDLMLEWSRLYGIYQARAYGRPATTFPLPEE